MKIEIEKPFTLAFKIGAGFVAGTYIAHSMINGITDSECVRKLREKHEASREKKESHEIRCEIGFH